MAYRICMNITRSDKSGLKLEEISTWVFPWERPILEEIHGSNASVVSIDELASMQGAKRIVEEKHNKVNPNAERAPGLREQYEAMQRVHPDDDPFHNIDAEYGRLENKYGTHTTLPTSNVNKIFGSPTQFRRAIRDYRSDTPPDVDPLYPEDIEDDSDLSDKAPADMTISELREAIIARAPDTKLPPRLGREKLEAMLVEEMASVV